MMMRTHVNLIESWDIVIFMIQTKPIVLFYIGIEVTVLFITAINSKTRPSFV